jgi:hypothetical protein
MRATSSTEMQATSSTEMPGAAIPFQDCRAGRIGNGVLHAYSASEEPSMTRRAQHTEVRRCRRATAIALR